MDISFSAVINTLLFSTIAILSLSYLIANLDIISKQYFYFLFFIILMIMLRLFLPFELPFQNNINITKIWPDIYVTFIKQNSIFSGDNLSLLSMTIPISIVGSIICMTKFILSYFIITHKIHKYQTVNNNTLYKLVKIINDGWNKTTQFSLVSNKEISTPFIFGLQKPTIALPELELSDDEWYYILSHEMSHYYNKDLWIRFACELLQTIYWWNPFIYILRKQIIKIQEIYIDTTIINKLNEIQKLNYLECLIKIAKLQPIRKYKWIATFNNKMELKNRIEILLANSNKQSIEKKHKLVNRFITFILIIFTLFLPNIIIFEPYHIPDEILENTFTINAVNSYLILNENGTYDLYTNGEYITTVNMIFDENLEIFNDKGEKIK
ncbi:MAG: M56 family metallopeptidase [Lachnospiraceae bacterium]|nr:M56 family metallopeptidase [Lachnospiraceae bacterium]